jgi:hypothetical protein
MPNLPRGSLEYGTASNSGAAADPKRVRRRFAVKAFRPRASSPASISTLRAGGGCGSAHRGTNQAVRSCRGCQRQEQAAGCTGCSWTGHGSAPPVLLVHQINTCRSCEGVKGVRGAGDAPAVKNSGGAEILPWRYSGEIGRPATARGGWRGVAVSAVGRWNSGPSCRAVGGAEVVKRERRRGSASARHRRGC